MFDSLYKNLVPEIVYGDHDRVNDRSIWREDIEKYTERSEILIGKNVDNMNKRKLIKEK